METHSQYEKIANAIADTKRLDQSILQLDNTSFHAKERKLGKADKPPGASNNPRDYADASLMQNLAKSGFRTAVQLSSPPEKNQ